MISIDLTHEGYAEAFADCVVGESKTITFVVTEKSETEIVGELETYEQEEADEPEAEYAEEAPVKSKSRTPRGVTIAVSGMK